MDRLEEIANLLVDCFKGGNKVLTFGVGGNAANAIHFAAELAGKYEEYEEPLPCIDLCSNPSVLTAITNDFGWEHVFERQIRALAKPGDVVVAFSVSTNGDYLHNAIQQCMSVGCYFILVCGKVSGFGKFVIEEVSNLSEGYAKFYIDQLRNQKFYHVWELGSDNTPWVQEEQLRMVHQICLIVKSRVEVA